MASIGDVRKTSNGCEVAKRVPRKKSGFRVNSENIAAIDFGTTNCSVAYTTVGSGSEEGPRRLPLNTTFYRVPTAILFKPDGSIDSFGYDARTEYLLNLDNQQRLEYAYFEQIKMTLQHDEVLQINYKCTIYSSTCSIFFFLFFSRPLQNVSREVKIKAKNGNEYYLVDVIAQILKYLKIALIEKLKHANIVTTEHSRVRDLEATDFDWVITVPAIWKARGKQMMREAGYKVDKLRINFMLL